MLKLSSSSFHLVFVGITIGFLLGGSNPSRWYSDRSTTKKQAVATHNSAAHDDLNNDCSRSAMLAYQIEMQEKFQSMIQRNQFPSACTRRLLKGGRRKPYDGLGVEIQTLARLLQVAVATQRTLDVTIAFRSAYVPPNCQWSNETSLPVNNGTTDFLCLWLPITNCTSLDNQTFNTNQGLPEPFSTRQGIVSESSGYFVTQYYGENADTEANWRNHPPGQSDIVAEWERLFGRYWIRAQTAHFLFRPSPQLWEQVQPRLQDKMPTPFVGMHIRFTDNVRDFLKDFGRNASVTRSIDNFMKHANEFRLERPDLKTVYVATDNDQIVRELQERADNDWTFVIQKDVARSSGQRFLWFANTRAAGAPAMVADLEMLRRADYLIGGFQSNIYRLACELNTAYHYRRYPYWQLRHKAVDVEWYEDP